MRGQLVAVHHRQADVEERDVGARSSSQLPARDRRRGDLHLVAAACAAASASESAASTLSSTTSTAARRPRAGRAGRGAPSRRWHGAASTAAAGDDEVAAPARPVAVRLDAARRAAAPGSSPAPGRCPSPPSARSSVRAPCTNRSNTCGSSVGVDADAVVAARDHDFVRRRAAAASAMWPPRVGVLGGVGQQVGDHLRQPRRRRRSHAQAGRPARRRCSWWRRCSSSGLRHLDRAA